MTYKPLLVFENLVAVAVERPLGNVGVYVHLFILVALTYDPALALFHVRRAVRRVQVVQRHKPLLYVRTRAALFRAADEYSYCAAVDFIEQGLLLLVGVRFVDIRYLVGRNAALDELVFQVVVCVEVRAVYVVLELLFRRGQIAKHYLRALEFRRAFPYLVNVLGGYVDFTARFVLRFGNKTARIERELFAVRRDFEHIVYVRAYKPVVYKLGAFGDLLRERYYRIRRFEIDNVLFRFGYVELYHVRRLHVRKAAVHSE